MNKPKFIMLQGLPGSGKSTWAENYKLHKENVSICSGDNLRETMFGNVNDQSHNAEVFEALHKIIKEKLRAGETVIYDATNISRKRRMAFLNELKNDGIDCVKIIVVFAVPFIECLRRNWYRERKVPYEVMDRMYRHWWTPGYFEGWDEIEINHDGTCFDYTPTFIEYDQNNPNHTLTLGLHMRKARRILIKNDDTWPSTEQAALYHDIGKPFCRIDDENGISHYYNHENVGAYDVLSICDVDGLVISLLINYHMMPFSWKASANPEEVMDKWKKILGEEFFTQLMILHEADIAAK